MALTVEEIKIKVTSEDSGLKKLNSEITQLETKIKALQNAPRGNVSNFRWFKEMETTLQNAKIAQQQLTTANTAYGQSLTAITSNIGGYITQLATVIALQKAWEISLQSAKFEVLKSNFKGLESDLDAFRKSTAGTVSDANLIKLSNQATDLGVGLKEQAILFALAEDAADKYGTSIEEGFSKVVMASEGNVKGLKSLGIQKEVYEAIVKDLAKAHGDEIDKLDAETQKQIRLEAIIKASNITYEDAINKTRDSADEQERMIAIVGNLTDEYGGLIVKGLIPLYNAFLKLPNAIDGVISNFEFAKTQASDLASYIYDLTNGLLGLQKVAGDSSKVFVDAGEDFVQPFSEQDAVNSGVTRKGKGFTSTKKTGSKTGSKNIKETTELIKNLGKEAQSVSGALFTIAQLDLSQFQPLQLADEISIVRQRITEDIDIMISVFDNFASSAMTAMGDLFGSFVPPQNALNPFQQFIKSIALAFINSVQAMIFAAGGAASAKGITTFGISLITDLPLLAAAWTALEAAKGFLGSFKDGSDMIRIAGNRSSDSGFARVSNGEMIMNARAVQQNYPTLQAMQRGQVAGSESSVYISADVAGMLKIHKKNTRDLRQQNKWKRY